MSYDIDFRRDRFYGKGCFHQYTMIYPMRELNLYFLWILKEFSLRWRSGVSTSHIIFDDDYKALSVVGKYNLRGKK